VSTAEQRLRRLLGPNSDQLQQLVDQVLAEAVVGPEPRTADAADHPCQLYAHGTGPRPVRTQGHHRLPQYLQLRLWGEVRDHDLLWLCGSCHDTVHALVSHWIDGWRRPDPWPGQRAQREARRTVLLYQGEQVELQRGRRRTDRVVAS
jgi:hypothetical protein